MNTEQLKQWYKDGQAAWVKLYDVRIGTKVKVLRGYRYDELGCRACNISSDNLNHWHGTVREIGYDFIRVRRSNHPFFVLEVVGQPDPKDMTVAQISEELGYTVKVVE